MNYYRIQVDDRKAGGIETIADFIMQAVGAGDAQTIAWAAYPMAFHVAVTQVTFPDD